ncbi:MAG TPA: hypothetical protein VMH30_09360 [Verrucomicrobiae bacterium]|nr:hypothetical protein [Verrucomicrobiae bacterium]
MSWLTDKADQYFTAEQALAYGLVDAIYDAPKIVQPSVTAAPVTDAAAPVPSAPKIGAREQLFLDFVVAFTADGKFEVHDRNEFFTGIFSMLTFSTTEPPK